MKVMLVITKGEVGGAQTHVLSLCQALSHQVQYVAAIGGGEVATHLGDALTLKGALVCYLQPLGNSLSPLRLIESVRALLRLIRQQQPDILHAHSAVAGVVSRIAGRIANVPVIYTVHGFGFKPQVSPMRRWAAWLAEYALAPWTGQMVCVSQHERNLARGLPLKHDRIGVIHNGVPDTVERANPSLQPLRIVMVARLAPPKRPDVLLQSLALLRDTLGYEVSATLIGSGSELKSLQSLAEQLNLHSVDFTGDVSNVAQRLAEHSIFVLMSDHEGLPISVIEAMRAGLAIVASDLPGMRELIAHGQNGLLVPNQPSSLAPALKQLIASVPLRIQLGQAARLAYEAGFTLDKMALSTEALYFKLGHARNKIRPDPHP